MSSPSAYIAQKSWRGRGDFGWADLERRGELGPLAVNEEEPATADVIGVTEPACIGTFRACNTSGVKPLMICTSIEAELAAAFFWAALWHSIRGEGSPLKLSGILSNAR